jgi:hypothetical protein
MQHCFVFENGRQAGGINKQSQCTAEDILSECLNVCTVKICQDELKGIPMPLKPTCKCRLQTDRQITDIFKD